MLSLSPLSIYFYLAYSLCLIPCLSHSLTLSLIHTHNSYLFRFTRIHLLILYTMVRIIVQVSFVAIHALFAMTFFFLLICVCIFVVGICSIFALYRNYHPFIHPLKLYVATKLPVGLIHNLMKVPLTPTRGISSCP